MAEQKRKGADGLLYQESRFWRRTVPVIAGSMFVVIVFCVLSGRYACSKWVVLQAFFYGLFDCVIILLQLPARLIPGLQYSLQNPIPVTWEENVDTVLWTVRIPRILAVIFIGGGLALSGASYQCLFRNPLVSESILGVSAGASFGAALGILLMLGDGAVTVMAFAAGKLAYHGAGS